MILQVVVVSTSEHERNTGKGEHEQKPVEVHLREVHESGGHGKGSRNTGVET